MESEDQWVDFMRQRDSVHQPAGEMFSFLDFWDCFSFGYWQNGTQVNSLVKGG